MKKTVSRNMSRWSRNSAVEKLSKSKTTKIFKKGPFPKNPKIWESIIEDFKKIKATRMAKRLKKAASRTGVKNNKVRIIDSSD